MFLYIDPLKQGLKHKIAGQWHGELITVFIHRSIKTRIETPHPVQYCHYLVNVFIHRSIKTRIETVNLPNNCSC